MHSFSPSRQTLRIFYGTFAFLALVAASKATFFPRWPTVKTLDSIAIQKSLTKAGYTTTTQIIADPYRTSDLARSSILSYRFPDGHELRLARGSVRHRFNMQTAVIAKSSKKLQLSQRLLSQDPIVSAIGRQDGRWSRQTCYVSDPEGGPGAFATTKDQLTLLVDRFSSTRAMKMQSLLGLVPNRHYACVLVSLNSPVGSGGAVISQQRWNAILEAIRPSLSS